MKNGRYTHPKVKQLVHLLRRLDDYLETEEEWDSPVSAMCAYNIACDMLELVDELCATTHSWRLRLEPKPLLSE